MVAEDGEASGSASTPGNLTERQPTRETLHESEARFRAIFEHSAIGMVLSDTDGRFLETNPAMQAMLGYSQHELRGMTYPQVTHPDDVAATLALSQDLRAGRREYFRQEKRYVRKDGRVVWGDLTVSLVRDTKRRPRCAVGMVEYITERKQAEQDLRIRARQQAAVADFGKYALAGSDLARLCQEAAWLVAQALDVQHSAVFQLSPAKETLLLRAGVGWSDGEVGRVSLSAGKDTEAGYALLTHGPVIVQDVRTETRFASSPLLSEHGIVSSLGVIIPGKTRPYGVLGAYSTHPRSFTRDDVSFLNAIVYVLATTIERELEEEEFRRHSQELAMRVLQAQEEERSRLARELHDDTVQALSALLVNLDLLEPDLPPGPAPLARFEQVRSIAQHALQETRSLAYALRPTTLDHADLIPALRRLAKEYGETFGLRVELQVEAPAGADPGQVLATAILRIAREALSNACRHARADWVRVRLSVTDDLVELVVEDNGHGFDLDQVTHPDGRDGLGLHSMQERANLLGGELKIATARGTGTRIVLAVPVAGTATTDRHRPTTIRQPHAGSKTTVLLVDDHAMFREGLRSVLDVWPRIIVVGEAEDGRQGIQLVDALRPDVVVMDIAMPNLNGFDATRQIKLRSPDTKVIILTTYENREHLVQTVKVGADACVLKRSVGAELVAAIEAVVQGHRYVSPAVAGMLLEDYERRIEEGGEDLLTDREREVLQLVAEGKTNQAIAHQLVVSVKTVEGHRTKIMRKLGAHDRTDLVKYAIRTGMIQPG